MEFYRNEIEKHIYKVNFYINSGKKCLYEDGIDRYEVRYTYKSFKVKKVFLTLEEAKQYNEYCKIALTKAKYNECHDILGSKPKRKYKKVAERVCQVISRSIYSPR